MRVVVVTGDLDLSGTHPWLVDDLVAAIVRQGATVDVVRADPRRPSATREERRALPFGLIDLAPPRWTFSGRVAKVLSSRGASLARRGWCILRLALAGRRSGGPLGSNGDGYDLVLQFSIGTLNAGLPARLRRRGVAQRSVFVMWDFFPVHQLEIGHMPRVPLVVGLLRQAERASVASADTVTVMSPRNEEFLEAYLKVRPAHTLVVPPWSTAGDEVLPGSAKRTTFTVVFGGQLVAGRDVGVLLAAAARLSEDGLEVDVLVIGDGAARVELEAQARRDGLSSVHFLGRLPRSEYRAIAASCHVGLSVTSADVSVPSFPSKIPEFLGLGLPVVAATEDSTDAGEIVERLGVGFWARSADVGSVVAALHQLHAEHAAGRLTDRARLARQVWEEEFSVEAAARKILAAADVGQTT